MAVVLVVAVGTSSVSAWAEPSPAAASNEALAAEARRHYEEGTKAFNLSEFARAVAEFKAAYNAKPDPLLLYNIAQTFRLAGDDGQALLFYRSFLRNMPDAPNRREVEGRIRMLEKRVAEHTKEAGAAPIAPAPAFVPPAPTPAGVPDTSPPPPIATSPVPSPATEPPTSSPPSDPRSPPPPTVSVAPVLDLGVPTTTAAVAHPPAPAGQLDISKPAEVRAEDGAPSRDRPLYKKWWLWAGVGVVVLVAIAIAGNVSKAPSTNLGLYQPAFR